MIIYYDQILTLNYPDSLWQVQNNDYNTLEWYSDTPKPTKEELDALWEPTQKILNDLQADINRRNAYVAEADPLFFKAQRGEATMQEWQNKINEIKLRYPK